MGPENAFSSCFPSSSTSTRKRTHGYDVFLSFRGSDTRKKFTSHLYEAFKRNGIIAFRDDESLDRGAFIQSELLKAIEASKIAVVIFSGGYASSSWCLAELAKIVECMDGECMDVECMDKKKLTVLPVFHDVDPSDVRKLRGTFADAFAKHLIDNTEKVQTWKDAVSKVAGISGWDLQDESESTVIEKIIQRINNELDREVPTAFQEIGSIRDVEAELENIKNTVSTFRAVLQDAAEQQSRSHQDKDWLEKLKDAVYEVDDLLDEFYTEALQQGGTSGNIPKEVRNFLSTPNRLVLSQEMSGKINAMKQKLNAIAEDRKLFHLKEYHVEPPVSMDREETHSFVLDEKVIGREDDKKAIIKLLLEPNNEENVSIVPIVGIGGLGKTTLAQFVYNDKNIKEHFELKMWICTSNVFDVKMIIQKIISATGKKLEDHNMDKLQDQLRKIINQKKYLLVLDDVWNEDPHKWESLEDLLAGGAKGSKIVITTRARLVAEITCPASIYTLKGLNEEQSWLLFKQIAFRKGQGQGTNNPRLEEIGREIVHKCQGIPLAIKSIGNVLRLEKTEHKWSYVKKNILEIATQQKNDIFPILKLSYDHLPSHLKSCFAFCSLFPKDYEIDKVTLAQLWIAQGFIRPSNKNQELEDVANEYFKDLLWRSFFEEVNVFRNFKYKMHDLIHDLAQLVAGAEFAS
nr:putative disease resistance protein RGA3 [Quercus suber]